MIFTDGQKEQCREFVDEAVKMFGLIVGQETKYWLTPTDQSLVKEVILHLLGIETSERSHSYVESWGLRKAPVPLYSSYALRQLLDSIDEPVKDGNVLNLLYHCFWETSVDVFKDALMVLDVNWGLRKNDIYYVDEWGVWDSQVTMESDIYFFRTHGVLA